MGKDLRGKELGVGIVQEKSGLYMARFVDKFGKRQTKRFKKLQECRQWVADATYIDKHTDLSVPSDMLVDAWYEYWISMKKKTVRPNTVRNYAERYARNIKPIIGNMKLTEVKPIHCQAVFNQMSEEGYCSSTMYQARITLFNLLEFAKENEAIIQNPCKRSVRSDIGVTPSKKEALTIDTQKRFLDMASNYCYYDQYAFVLQTGLRTGELVGLKWSDIDFKSKTLSVERSMEFRYGMGSWRIEAPKTKAGIRKIPLTSEAIRILEKQKEEHKKLKVIPLEWKDQVFLNRKGEPVKNSAYDTHMYEICDKAGIPHFSMHVLRHTFATRCIEAGMKPKTLQMILGHANIGITMNLYVHTTEDEKHKEIRLVEDALKVV